MEILFYTGVYDFTAESFIQSLNDANGKDVTIRLNSGGGSVMAGWGMIAKMSEYEGKITLKVDGIAASMASMFPLYADTVEALDVTTFMLHRADMWVSTPEDQSWLDSVNKSLRSKMEKKIDGVKLKELKGVSFNEIFDPNKRIDVFLTAKEAKAIGLVDKINKVDPSMILEANKYLSAAASLISGDGKFENKNGISEQNNDVSKQVQNQSQNQNTVMTIDELKAKHPDVYAAAVAVGVASERDRVSSFMKFVDVDAKLVADSIEKGDTITQSQIIDLTRKSISKEMRAELEKDGKDAGVDTGADASKTAEQKELDDYNRKVEANLKKQGLLK